MSSVSLVNEKNKAISYFGWCEEKSLSLLSHVAFQGIKKAANAYYYET